MQPSTILLYASLGAISVLLMLYVYIYLFERRSFIAVWFTGWLLIGLNYGLDAFFPDLLRQNRLILALSLGSYFGANLMNAWGVLRFLRMKARMPLFAGIGFVWLCSFIFLCAAGRPDLHLIQYTTLSVFAVSCWVGAAMVRSTRRYGGLALFIGCLNIAWVANTLLFSYILKMPQMAPYVVSQIILIFNAIGLIQLFLREQRQEIERGHSHISYLAFHDELTGLYNKACFDRKVQELAADEDCLPISLLVGDMNGLKFVNDVFGHQEGDNWLKRMAQIIRQSCRREDIAARWGGDEFAMILPRTGHEAALEVRRRIYDACRNFQQTDVLLSISLGVATKADPEQDLSAKLKEAEELMYETKLIEGKKARWAIAETLGNLLQKKGYETKGHMQRMEKIATAFAHPLGLSKENQSSLLQAVSLHDIGKIGMPESIVLKEARLDESEWTAMKKHVEVGYRIAHASGEFAGLADIILYHHEWWNGQGYPQGLTGEDIPLLSRIISIVDAFDVMTHNQPYQKAKDVNEALDELRRKAGIQFDPALVEAFVKMVTEQSPDLIALTDSYLFTASPLR